MENCNKCGFKYNDKKELEKINLISTEGSIEYYCPKCKTFICRKKITSFS